eukprot:gene869-164_t
MTKKYLKLDHSAVAACLYPGEIASQSQECYIYNPALAKYVYVTSSSPVMKEQQSKLVETDSDIRGHGKHFKLKSCGDGMYHIVTLDEDGEENGFLYLSEKTYSGMLHRCANILKSNEVVQGNEKNYVFEICESKSQWGLYKIQCCGKSLFASKGAHTYVLADDKDLDNCDEAWFQFNLKTRIVKKESSKETRRYDTSIRDTVEHSFVYDNTNAEAVSVKFNRKDKDFVIVEGHSEGEDAESVGQGEANELLPTNPITVEPNSKLILQFTAKLTTYTTLKKIMIETESGKKFSGLQEQDVFLNQRGWKF